MTAWNDGNGENEGLVCMVKVLAACSEQNGMEKNG